MGFCDNKIINFDIELMILPFVCSWNEIFDKLILGLRLKTAIIILIEDKTSFCNGN